jgi:Tol biopolymer transport system component
MSAQIDLDRQVKAYFEARSTNQAPGGLIEAALAGVERTRQRPAWSVAEWWLGSMGRRVAPGTRQVLLAGLVGPVLLSFALAIVIGSSRHRLPPPFGLAKPGLVAFDQGGHIFVSNDDGTGSRQLTSGSDTDYRPIWSPDGTKIAFESRREDLTWAVIVMRPDRQDRVTLADGLSLIGGISWSPDSRRVAFGGHTTLETGGNEYYDWRLYVADADHPGSTRLGGPDVFGLAPSWSPDGKVIAFKRVYPCCDGYDDITLWRIDIDGTNRKRLSSQKELYNNLGGDDAFLNTAWSPDGKRLAFVADGVPPVADPMVDAAYDVYVVNADATGEHDVTRSPDEESWPSWSPDGSRIAFVRMLMPRPRAGFMFSNRGAAPLESHVGTLVVADPDGSKVINMQGPSVDDAAPIWSPDGKRLIAYEFDETLLNDRAFAIFDPSARLPTITVPIDGFNGASWQRLALDPDR